MIDMAVPLEDFLFDAVAEGLNIRTMEGRATFSKRAAPLLEKLPKGVFRELMFENLATRTGLSRSILQDLVSEPVTLTAPDPVAPAPKPAPKSATTTQESAHNIASAHQIAPVPNAPQGEQAPDFYADEYDYGQLDAPPPSYDETYSGRPTRQTESYRQSIHHQPKLQAYSSASNRYLVLPAPKAIALLLAHPNLAELEPNHDDWLAQSDESEKMLGQLLKVLHERPHYNISHLIGYWRGVYGAAETEKLATIAGNDLLQAANAISQERENKAAKADYDTQAAFQGCLETLRRQQTQKISADSLEKLKNSDLTQLSKAERDALVRAALANKLSQTE
jgi:DNA primase